MLSCSPAAACTPSYTTASSAPGPTSPPLSGRLWGEIRPLAFKIFEPGRGIRWKGPAGGAGMQFIESSIIGIRSAVITLTHRTTPLRFILFPMVHVAEQQFYDEVAARARLCQLIVAEGIPSQFAPAQEW